MIDRLKLIASVESGEKRGEIKVYRFRRLNPRGECHTPRYTLCAGCSWFSPDSARLAARNLFLSRKEKRRASEPDLPASPRLADYVDIKYHELHSGWRRAGLVASLRLAATESRECAPVVACIGLLNSPSKIALSFQSARRCYRAAPRSTSLPYNFPVPSRITEQRNRACSMLELGAVTARGDPCLHPGHMCLPSPRLLLFLILLPLPLLATPSTSG